MQTFCSLIACYLVRLDEQFLSGAALSKYFSGKDGSAPRKRGTYAYVCKCNVKIKHSMLLMLGYWLGGPQFI